MAIRRVLRSGESLLEANQDAPNRFQLLGSLYRAQQAILGLENSEENREGLLALCRKLAEAPNDYADIRFEAELLLSQTEQARKGVSPSQRAGALRSFITRYRDTSVEKKMLMIVTAMTLELGNDALLFDLQETIEERFWNDLEMLRFRRDKLGGQVMAAPFHARLTDSEGHEYVFPQDRLSRSTIFFVWSKDTEDIDERIAKWNTLTGNTEGPQADLNYEVLNADLFDVISVNLDGLPDAGKSILRAKGLNWTALHLPGGRDSELYKTFFRADPMGLHVSPTGCAALLLPGSHPDDYPRRVRSYMQQDTYYLRQLTSLFSGEFLVVDPVADFNPAMPPELKAATPGNSKDDVINRTAECVPTNVLFEIQACFPPPPFSHDLAFTEAFKNYQKAEALCRKAIEDHNQAPDIWLVHNRLIASLMGQYRCSSSPSQLFMAGKAAAIANGLESPDAAKVVPRMCLARINLRHPDKDPADIIEKFVAACGGEDASAPAVAAAAYMALDVGNRALHEKYRRVLLDKHADNPAVWPVASALLDRFHLYQKFFHPYHRGWSFGRRAARYYKTGEPQDANRTLKGEFLTLDNKPIVLPGSDAAELNVLLFMPTPTEDQRQSKRYKPWEDLHSLSQIAEARQPGEVKVWNILYDKNAIPETQELDDATRQNMLILPNGIRNPMVQQCGLYQAHEQRSMVIVRRDGRIVNVVSGLSWHGVRPSNILQSTLEWADEAAVDAAIARGDMDAALDMALRHAPLVEDPDPKPKRHNAGPGQTHLRCRAKVYIAMKDWKKALPDVDLLVDRQRLFDAGMSVESQELLEALALQAMVHDRLGLNKEAGEINP
jgi:hypothetical protein